MDDSIRRQIMVRGMVAMNDINRASSLAELDEFTETYAVATLRQAVDDYKDLVEIIYNPKSTSRQIADAKYDQRVIKNELRRCWLGLIAKGDVVERTIGKLEFYEHMYKKNLERKLKK